VQYLTILVAVSSLPETLEECEEWSKIGQAEGDDNSYTLTLNDSNSDFEGWFGLVRPQYMIIDPSGEFKNIDPDPTGCTGSCGVFNDNTTAKYETMLAPYLNSSVTSNATQTLNPASAAAAKNVFNVFANAVVFLFVTFALCVQM